MSNPWDSVYHDLRKPFYEGDDTKQKNIKAAKKGKRWQDDNANGKWYEPGTDVKEDTGEDQRAAIEKAKTDRIQDLKVASKKKKDVKEEGIADIIARLEKKRISKGGDPKESPLPAMRKYHAAKKKKKVKEEVVQEADSLAGQVSRWEAARQKRMKQRQSYERPHWIPRDQDHEDNWGSSKGEKKKPQKKKANLQNEEGVINHIDGSKTEVIDIVPNPHARKRAHEDWRSDLEYFDEGKKKVCTECGSTEHTVSECDVKNEGKVPHPTDEKIKEGNVKNKITINPVVNVESITLTLGDYGSRNVTGSAYNTAAKNKFKGYKAGGGLGSNFLPLANSHEPEGDMVEAKVDAGKSPEEKEAARNYRKFGTRHNQAKTGALRRSLHRLKRGDKITKGEKNDWREEVEGEKKNIDEGGRVKYYSGQDRNPNTGLPKGLKATPVRTEKEVSKKIDRTTLAQSYDPEGEMIEAKIDDKKYGKGKGWDQPEGKSMTSYKARHSYLKKNPPNVRSDRNKRHSEQDVVFYGHDKVERDRKKKHFASKGVKKVKGAKVDSGGVKALKKRFQDQGAMEAHQSNSQVISELDNAGGPAALGAVLTAGAGLAKVGFDAVNKVRNSLQKKVQQKNKLLNQETEYANIRKIIDEHHQKDANGKVIEHGDGTPSSVEENWIKTLIDKAKENAAKRKKWREENPGGTISKQTHLNQIRNQGGDTSHWEEKSLLDQVAQITLEATRLKKEKGYDKGGTKKPKGPKPKDAALDAIKAKYKGQIMRSGSNQPKKVKGAKSGGEGKYLKQHKANQQLKKDAKEMGYGNNVKGYIETRARYGSKENMKKGRGLGT